MQEMKLLLMLNRESIKVQVTKLLLPSRATLVKIIFILSRLQVDLYPG